MRQSFKVHGPPGTGKTTFLANKASLYLRAGGSKIGPEDLCISSFTRAAAFRSRETIAAQSGCKPEELEWAGTLHSHARRLIGAKRANKAGKKHLVPLFKSLGIQYTPPVEESDSDDLFDDADEVVDDKGKWFLSFWDWFRSMNLPKDDFEVALAVPSFPGGFDPFGGDRSAAEAVALRCWRHYEDLLNNLGLWDFPRLIETAIREHARPKCRILFIDECQDLSPLLWKLALQWRDAATVSWFAGDPYQAIYEFAGATPDAFYDLQAELVALEQSYRLSQQQIDLALSVLRHDPKYRPFPWTGKPAAILEEQESDGSAVQLFRVSSTLRAHAKRLREHGFPYASNRAPSLVGSKAAKAAHAGLSLYDEGEMTLAELARFVKSIPVSGYLRRGVARKQIDAALIAHGSESPVRSDDLERLGLLPNLCELLEQGNPWPAIKKLDKETTGHLRALVDRAGGRDVLVNRPNLFLTTVHGSKGQEWGASTLHLTWGGRPYQAYQGPGRGAECRVGYVGVTRAKVRQGFAYAGGRCFPPLERFR